MLKKIISFLTLSSAAALYSPSVWDALFLSSSFFESHLWNTQSALTGQLTYARASATISCRLLN